MTTLLDLVPSLKRQVATPGDFDTAFPNAEDTDLVGYLGDAFGQAQLDGFFGTMVWDPTVNTVTPDLSPGGSAIVGLYAAEVILQAKFRNMATRTLYKAGTTQYEVDYSANVLAAEIKGLQTRRENLLKAAMRLLRASTPSVYVTDAYIARSFGFLPWFGGQDMNQFGFWAYELTGPW
jgi:hypothetical protein